MPPLMAWASPHQVGHPRGSPNRTSQHHLSLAIKASLPPDHATTIVLFSVPDNRAGRALSLLRSLAVLDQQPCRALLHPRLVSPRQDHSTPPYRARPTPSCPAPLYHLKPHCHVLPSLLACPPIDRANTRPCPSCNPPLLLLLCMASSPQQHPVASFPCRSMHTITTIGIDVGTR